MRLAPEPAIVIQLLSDQGAAGLLHYGSASDAEVLELLQQGAQREGLILAEDGEALAFELVSSSHWAPYAMVVELGASDLNLGILQKQGQALTFALVRMVRESILNTD
jgi:hypothetical protein